MRTEPARGMRDFLPKDVRRRQYVIDKIRSVYDRYGFEPLETPSVENIETLLGNYGDEGGKLIFKIKNRGEHEETGEADLALRYDLTVPLARVVAEYQGKLPRVFKRYQIQPVWRAERPGRGRFREFYQCDIDSIGSTSQLVEVELINAAFEAMTALGFRDFTIRLSDRRFLSAWLSRIPIPLDRQPDAIVTIDKVDKIGKPGVAKELEQKGFEPDQINAVDGWIGATYPLSWLEWLSNQFAATGDTGIDNLLKIAKLLSGTSAAGSVKIDPSLARGLGYYTGTIMEISVPGIGSLGGGGRYDNLIGRFLGHDIPACGMSLGLERILVVMDEKRMFLDEEVKSGIDVVVFSFDAEGEQEVLEVASALRMFGSLRVDLYPQRAKKFGDLFKYFDQRGARYAVGVRARSEARSIVIEIRDLEKRMNIVGTLGALLDGMNEKPGQGLRFAGPDSQIMLSGDSEIR